MSNAPLSPKPLSPARFYILLILSTRSLHGYALKNTIFNASLGSVDLKDGNFYPLLTKMFDAGLIEMITEDAKTSSKPKIIYNITDRGLLDLKADLQRLRHALKVAERAQLLEDTTPIDIQRLIVNAQAAARPKA